MIAFQSPVISALADGCYRTNAGFGLTMKLGLNVKVEVKLQSRFNIITQEHG